MSIIVGILCIAFASTLLVSELIWPFSNTALHIFTYLWVAVGYFLGIASLFIHRQDQQRELEKLK